MGAAEASLAATAGALAAVIPWTTSDGIAGVSALLAVVALITSIATYRGAVRAASRPVLVFSMTSTFRWELRNVGAGPAIRLTVSDIDTGNVVESITNCHPLAAGAAHDLSWLLKGMTISALYEDVHGRVFSTTCNQNENVIRRVRRPDWQADAEQWVQRLRPGQPARTLLSISDLRGKTAWDLDMMRGEIYAKHGYAFSRSDLRRHFDTFDWYRPTKDQPGEASAGFSAEDTYESYMILVYELRHALVDGIPAL